MWLANLRPLYAAPTEVYMQQSQPKPPTTCITSMRITADMAISRSQTRPALARLVPTCAARTHASGTLR